MSSNTLLAVSMAVSLALLSACGGEHVHILNGFDVPVKLSVQLDKGDTKTFTVPPRGKIRTGLLGKGTVTVSTAANLKIAESSAFFGPPDKEGEQCQRMFNVQGAAAVVQEDLKYGTGFGVQGYRLAAGDINDDFCTATYVFEEPPEAIAVEAQGPQGRNLGWVHYLGDGGWLASVNALLEDTGRHKGQSRAKAQRIVATVVLADPENPALAELTTRFKSEGLAWPDEAYRAKQAKQDARQKEREARREARAK